MPATLYRYARPAPVKEERVALRMPAPQPLEPPDKEEEVSTSRGSFRIDSYVVNDDVSDAFEVSFNI